MARIGTSGWAFDQWDGVLYEPGLDTKKRLAAYATRFDTVELDSSAARWPRTASFAAWAAKLPEGFRLSVRAPQALTSGKRGFAAEAWTERITAGWAELGAVAGVLIVTVAADVPEDAKALDALLKALPKRVPVAVEFLGADWHVESVFRVLERRRASYVVASGAGLPCILRATNATVVVRLHGPDPHTLDAGWYSDADLDWWADRIREWEAQGREVFAYFSNVADGAAVRNAEGLAARLA